MIAVFTDDLTMVNSLLDRVHIAKRETVGNTTLLQAQIGKDAFLIVQAGCGKVNLSASYHLAVQRFPIEIIIGIGDCGCLLTEGVHAGTVAVSTHALQYDVNCTAIGEPAPQLPGMEKGVYTADERLVRLALRAAQKVGVPVIKALFGTADRFAADEDLSKRLRAQYSIDCVDMECADTAQLAFLNKTPWVYIKGVSNLANRTAAGAYRKHRSTATENACAVVYPMLRALLDPHSCLDCNGEENMSCDISLCSVKPLPAEGIEFVLSHARYVRLSVAEDGQPYTVPMAFSWHKSRGAYIFCLYSRDEGQKMRCISANSAVALEFDLQHKSGVDSVAVKGTAQINHGNFDVACNKGLSALRITAQQVTGRRYSFCK